MMTETEIKHEYGVLKNQCRVCMSVGRKLYPLGEYNNVFKRIISEFEYQSYLPLDKIQLCWECMAVLRKVTVFQQQVHKAHETFQLGQYLYGPLSSLTIVILNDAHPHTIYMCETNIQTDTEAVPCDDDELSDHYDVHSVHEVDSSIDIVKCEDKVPETSVVESKKPKSNRWATKRVLQNKKPKFKIITDYTDTIFTKIHIKNEDLSSYLKSQRESEYFKSKRHKCIKCVLSFNNDNLLETHNKKYHNKAAPYTYDICNSRMINKRHLSTHISEHYYKYACKLCDFTCCDKSHRQSHFKRTHGRIFQCVKCELKFGNRKEFFKHYKEWHEKFICDHCGVSFKMKYCIKNHIRKQHSPFICVPCNKRFARYNGLWLHNKTTHARGAAAYCVECDTKYPDVYRYRWHLANSARHNRRAKTRVPCPGCDKVFSKNIYMKDHYNLVHLKYYKYRCEQCDKNFIRNADLVKHTRRVHEGILPPKNKICYMCGRGFSTNKILTNHMRTHTGERPHACRACDARFTQSAALRAHARAIHAGEKHT